MAPRTIDFAAIAISHFVFSSWTTKINTKSDKIQFTNGWRELFGSVVLRSGLNT